MSSWLYVIRLIFLLTSNHTIITCGYRILFFWRFVDSEDNYDDQSDITVIKNSDSGQKFVNVSCNNNCLVHISKRSIDDLQDMINDEMDDIIYDEVDDMTYEEMDVDQYYR